MMFRILIALVLLAVSSLARAGCSPAVCTDVYVEQLYVNFVSVVYVRTDGDETALNCTLVSNSYLTLDMNDSNSDALYSTLLAAQLADRKVDIRVVENSSNCKIAYIRLNRQ